MEITILGVYEQKGQLRVEVETPYGKENIGLSLESKYLDPETDKPRWKKEVKELLEKKYGSLENRQKKQLSDAADDINTTMSLDVLSPEP